MKIVLNRCYGGFGLSDKAKELLESLVGSEVSLTDIRYNKECRTSRDLIKVVETMGSDANSAFSNLKIIRIPNNTTDWDIVEYDGLEDIVYVVDGKIHRKWKVTVLLILVGYQFY